MHWSGENEIYINNHIVDTGFVMVIEIDKPWLFVDVHHMRTAGTKIRNFSSRANILLE